MGAHELTIVVVEDDASLREALERVLSAAGFQARVFPDAAQFLAAGGAHTAACLVLDVHLPMLSGFELYQQLVDAGVNPPVVFISAHDEPEERLQASSAGAQYLSKPFAGLRLVAAIATAIDASIAPLATPT